MFRVLILLAGLAAFTHAALGDDGSTAPAQSPEMGAAPCETVLADGSAFTVCTFPLSQFDISLHLSDTDGALFGQPLALQSALEAGVETVIAITNGGMYHSDRSPVGLYIESGEEKRPLVHGDGPGNFQLLPNGVFWIKDGVAGVEETTVYAEADHAPDFATQSGPMLVIDGEIHPSFRAASDSRFRRSGIGVVEDGDTVVFAISEQPVTFHAFASLFRDRLLVDNALFIEGKVCRLDLPGQGRHEPGLRMGPILAVTLRAAAPEN